METPSISAFVTVTVLRQWTGRPALTLNLELPRHAGMTGPRSGINDLQREWFEEIIKDYNVLHHGCAIGADAEAHWIALGLGLHIVAHPPTDMRYVEMKCLTMYQDRVTVLPRKEYMLRNRHIVNDSEILLAMPGEREYLRSGTWAAIRYARKMNAPRRLCFPWGEEPDESKR